MPQEHTWDREYKKPTFLTKENKPQADIVRFVHFLKKEQRMSFEGLSILDLGCGIGRNSHYFAERGARVTGYEISKTALAIANKNAKDAGFEIEYLHKNIGEKYDIEDSSVDIILDITSSNSLSDTERAVYLSETSRVLKNTGYFFVKALCKDGDANAKHLLKTNPGIEHDTYVMPETGIIERVWTKDDFIKAYSQHFEISFLEKKTSYTKMSNRLYKRNFWICYMKKTA